MKTLFTTLSVAVLLAACSTNTMSTPTTNMTPAATQTNMANPAASNNAETYRATYACQNGMTTQVRYFEDSSVMFIDTIGQTVTLPQVRSGSGALYISNKGFYGKTTEWHTKGKEGSLSLSDPYGNKLETVCKEK